MISSFVFIFGAVFGSFCNVVGVRMTEGKSISGRSHCDTCGYQLKWFNLVPIVSYVVQGGKCSKCKSKISFNHIAAELSLAVMFLLVYAVYGLSIPLFVFSCTLLISSIMDFKEGEVHDAVTVLGLLCVVLSGNINVVAAIITLTISFILSIIKYMGTGDVLILTSVSLLLGAPVLITLFLMGVSSLVYAYVTKSRVLPLVPFLYLGLILTLLQEIIR